MGASKVDMILDAKNRASGKIKQVKQDLGGLNQAATGAMGGLQGLAAAAGVASVVGLGALAMELQSTAARMEALESAGRRMASGMDDNLGSMVSALKTASAGMISEMDLVEAANKAMTLGVASSTEEMVALMNLAAERGPALGLSMSQAFNDLVTGLGRGSALILDNLGIVMDLNTVNKQYAESVGKTVAQLTEAEKKQALVNSVLSEAKGNTELIVDPTQQASAAWKDFRTELAQTLTDGGPIPDLLNGIADGLNAVNEGLNNQEGWDSFNAAKNELEFAQQGLANLNRLLEQGNHSETRKAALLDMIAQKEAYIAELQEQLAGEYVEVSKAEGQYYTQAHAHAASIVADQEALQAEIQATTDKLNALELNAQKAKASLVSALMSGATKANGGDAMAGYNLAQEKATQLQMQLNALALENNMTLEDAEKYILPQLIAGQNELWSDALKTSSAVAQISEEYNSLQSAVQNVLSGALDIGVGDDWKEGLPRPDAVNEDARRLADVAVKGFESPWAKYFQETFPQLWSQMIAGGDIKASASQLLSEFEQGLQPGLINRETAKERIRAIITGGENMKALASELAQEVAQEMGVSLEKARTAASSYLGGDPADAGGGAGAGFGDGAIEKVKGQDAGGTVVKEFLAQIRVHYETIKQEGKNAGEQWGGGFLETVRDGVPPELVSLLVDLVTPGVMANISREGTMTGADV